MWCLITTLLSCLNLIQNMCGFAGRAEVFDTLGSIPNIPYATKTIKLVYNCQWSEIAYKTKRE